MLSSLVVEAPPGVCRITHGPHDSYFPNLVGKPVASVRRSLATVFGIPERAESWVAGSVVGADYRLRPGDSVEFLVRRGFKGSSSPEELELIDKERSSMGCAHRPSACHVPILQDSPDFGSSFGTRPYCRPSQRKARKKRLTLGLT